MLVLLYSAVCDTDLLGKHQMLMPAPLETVEHSDPCSVVSALVSEIVKPALKAVSTEDEFFCP